MRNGQIDILRDAEFHEDRDEDRRTVVFWDPIVGAAVLLVNK